MIARNDWLNRGGQSGLARLKDELRIPQDDTGQDNLITNLIYSATAQVESDSGIVLIDKKQTIYVDFPPGFSPIIIKDEFSFVDQDHQVEIKYFEEQQDYNSNDFIVLELADDPGPIGNAVLSALKERDSLFIRTSDDSWPRKHYGRPAVTYWQGIPGDHDEIFIYEQLAILMVRFLYNGQAMMQPNSAYNTILQRHRRTTNIHDFKETNKGFLDG